MAETPAATPRFFTDPAIDKLTQSVLQLASEVWVLNERFAALQSIADAKGVITKDDLATFQPAGVDDEALAAARGAFIRRVLGPLNRLD